MRVSITKRGLLRVGLAEVSPTPGFLPGLGQPRAPTCPSCCVPEGRAQVWAPKAQSCWLVLRCLPGSQGTALLAQEQEEAPQEGSAALALLECPLLTVAVVWQRDQGSASQPPDQGRGAGATRRRKDQIYFCFGSNILGAVQQCQLKPDNYCSCKGQKNAKSELSILLRCLTANFHE